MYNNRVAFAWYFQGRHQGDYPPAGARHGDFLSCDRVKLFADGSMGASTAAVSLPYVGTDDQHGVTIYTQDDLNAEIQEAVRLGYRLEVHVIGDVAAEMTLTALEAAGVTPDMRPLLTHCQILREDLIDRMLKLGAVANIQPQFATTDSAWLHTRIPPELMRFAYAWKSLIKAGVPCAGGSDAPVEKPEPLLGIYDAIYRPFGKRDSNNEQCFKPEECLSVSEAIDMYTQGGAYATKREHDLGQLKPGYQADFVVLDSEDDVVTHPRAFCTASVAQVWVKGRLVYEK